MSSCARCDGFVVQSVIDIDWEKKENTKEHHKSLMELKSCVESGNCTPCPLCCLLWASIQAKTPGDVIEKLLKNWPASHTLVLRQPMFPEDGICLHISIAGPSVSNDNYLGSVELFASSSQ
jgi:hypothetical protein